MVLVRSSISLCSSYTVKHEKDECHTKILNLAVEQIKEKLLIDMALSQEVMDDQYTICNDYNTEEEKASCYIQVEYLIITAIVVDKPDINFINLDKSR